MQIISNIYLETLFVHPFSIQAVLPNSSRQADLLSKSLQYTSTAQKKGLKPTAFDLRNEAFDLSHHVSRLLGMGYAHRG